MIKRSGSAFMGMAVFGPMIGLLVAAVVTYVMPKLYESEATIEARPLSSSTHGGSLSSLATQEILPGKEFEKIKSRATIEKVIEKLELTNQWGVDQETAFRILDKIVSTEKISGTDLISVRVRHTNKEQARDIAAEVPIAFKNYLDALKNRDRVPALAELDKAVKAQDEKVEERRKHYAKLVRNMGAHPSITMHAEASDTPEEAITRKQDQQDILDAKRDFETDQELLQVMKLKQISETIKMKMSDDSVVIHDEPQISHVPVSPNLTINLFLGMGLGLLVSPLLGLAVSSSKKSPETDRFSPQS